MKLLREPLLHFMVIGTLIYCLYGVFVEDVQEVDDKTIVVSAGEIEWMLGSWQKRWNRPPTKKELTGLIDQYIKETVLYREALTMGLNQHDQAIRRRLAQKLEYLAKDLVALTPPTEEELQTYFDRNQQRYTEPLRYTFTQVFLDPDKRGDATLADAEKIKITLIALGDDIKSASELSDSFMLQSYYPEKDQIEIQKNFGSGFAGSLIELSPGQWHGPVLSGFGAHLVYVDHVTEPPAPLFADMREMVEADWKMEKGEELNKAFYANLRDSYTVEIDMPVIESLEEPTLGQMQ
tara:strand:+ start:1580 stop:2458 length:879 start_codon:yes stop_codon:yes gene_type:complete